MSISVYVVVLYVVSVMYLYLFSRINDSCMASPFIQLSKNTYFYWVICYYHAVIRNSLCQRTQKWSPGKMAVPGANFGGKRVGSNGLNIVIGTLIKLFIHCFYVESGHLVSTMRK